MCVVSEKKANTYFGGRLPLRIPDCVVDCGVVDPPFGEFWAERTETSMINGAQLMIWADGKSENCL